MHLRCFDKGNWMCFLYYVRIALIFWFWELTFRNHRRRAMLGHWKRPPTQPSARCIRYACAYYRRAHFAIIHTSYNIICISYVHWSSIDMSLFKILFMRRGEKVEFATFNCFYSNICFYQSWLWGRLKPFFFSHFYGHCISDCRLPTGRGDRLRASVWLVHPPSVSWFDGLRFRPTIFP